MKKSVLIPVFLLALSPHAFSQDVDIPSLSDKDLVTMARNVSDPYVGGALIGLQTGILQKSLEMVAQMESPTETQIKRLSSIVSSINLSLGNIASLLGAFSSFSFEYITDGRPNLGLDAAFVLSEIKEKVVEFGDSKEMLELMNGGDPMALEMVADIFSEEHLAPSLEAKTSDGKSSIDSLVALVEAELAKLEPYVVEITSRSPLACE